MKDDTHRITTRHSDAAGGKPLTWGWTTALGVYHLAFGILLAYLLYRLWPSAQRAGTEGIVRLFWGPLIIELSPSFDGRLLLITMIAGGLGGYVHAATSFVDYVGNRQFVSSWILWYLLRPFIAMALAVIVYLVVRAGFVSVTDGGAGAVNPYGIAALAALAGLFSKRATDKLDEIFSTVLRTAPGQGDEKRKDRLAVAAPSIDAVEPASVTRGTGAVAVTVRGSGFLEGATCYFGARSRDTEYRGPSELVARLDEQDTVKPGRYDIKVINPGPERQASNVSAFDVLP